MNETDQAGPPVVGPLEATVRPVAYLYHDANAPEDAHPWLHSTMLVLAADRRPKLRNETPLVTLAQAEAMVAAERERCLRIVRAVNNYDNPMTANDCADMISSGREYGEY